MVSLCLPGLLLVQLFLAIKTDAHGRLIEPPGRSSAWRFGYATPVNYNDNELFCGGFTVQWRQNNGKCGVCGDSYSGARANEFPDGKYARKLVITRTYEAGGDIAAKVDLTTNHGGFFTFKLCPADGLGPHEVTQECLDRHVLQVVGNDGKCQATKYQVQSYKPGVFEARLRLPKDITCERCVLQWSYTAGNNWGRCADGRGRPGCGPQETFRGCADVQVVADQMVQDAPVDEIEREGPPIVFSSTTPGPGRPRGSRPPIAPRRPPTQPPTRSPVPRYTPAPTRSPSTRTPAHTWSPFPTRSPNPRYPVAPTRAPASTRSPGSTPRWPVRPYSPRNPRTTTRPPPPPTPRDAPTARPTRRGASSTPRTLVRVSTTPIVPTSSRSPPPRRDTTTPRPPLYTRRPWSTSPRRPVSTDSTSTTTTTTTSRPVVVRTNGSGRSCRASRYMRMSKGLDEWCERNCRGGFCPATHCTCV